MAKEQEETADDEEANEEPLTPEEANSLMIDAEVFARAAAERIDALTEGGYLDEKTRDAIDAVWNMLLAKIDEME